MGAQNFNSSLNPPLQNGDFQSSFVVLEENVQNLGWGGGRICHPSATARLTGNFSLTR